MSFDVDFEGVEVKTIGPIPEGEYNLRIVDAEEKVSKKGDPMVVVDYEVFDGPYKGRSVQFHYVVFFKDKTAPGAGMSKSYLKNIDLPFEGNVRVNSLEWIGRILTAKVVHEKGQDGNDYARVKFIKKHIPDYTTMPQSSPKTSPKTPDGEDDPFGVE